MVGVTVGDEPVGPPSRSQQPREQVGTALGREGRLWRTRLLIGRELARHPPPGLPTAACTRDAFALEVGPGWAPVTGYG